MRITQCYISKSNQLIADGFRKRWNLTEYADVDSPCLFMGIYDKTDIESVYKNTSFKIIKFNGVDIGNYGGFNKIKNIHVLGDRIFEKQLSLITPPVKYLRIPLKDYSTFTPCKLGDKIYCYLGADTDFCRNHYGYSALERVINYFGRDKFLLGYQGNSMDTMIENYYKKSFLNIQLNPSGGFTSAMEMAHMGRMSISNHPVSFCFPYKSEDDIIKLIESESKKTGTVQKGVCELAKNSLHNSDDWLYTEYWK